MRDMNFLPEPHSFAKPKREPFAIKIPRTIYRHTVRQSFLSPISIIYLPLLHRSITRYAAPHAGGRCRRRCCSFIFTSGLTALFMWLSLRTYKPSCFIQDFYVPALNNTDNSTATRNNHTIYFDLKLRNGMKDKGVNYANINLTFFYYQNNSRLPIANYTEPEFNQGHGKTAHRKKLVEANGVPWAAAAFGAVSNGSTVIFRVDLATRVKFKIMFWYTKRHSLVVGGDVEVNNSGKKMRKKPIKLKSGVPDPGSHWVRVGLVAVFTFLMILLL